MSVNEERQFRQKLFDDITDNTIPHHVPSFAHVGFEAAIKYAGFDLIDVQWGNDPEPYYQAYKMVLERLSADHVQFTGARPIRALVAMGCKAFVMSESGYIQHPEVSSMRADEYDRFIADPYKFLVDVAIPRIYTKCDPEKYGNAATLAWLKGLNEFKANRAKVGAAMAKINAEFPQIQLYNGIQSAPMDCLSDVLRSFSEISKDARRCPEKILEACDALMPMLCDRYPTVPQKYRYTDYPLHMAPFLNTKQCEKLWWPSFKKLVTYGVEHGQSVSLFCEQNFERYLEMLNDLPGRILLRFEQCTPEKAKAICGEKHIISGMYSIMNFSALSKEACVDEAKKLCDVLAPGGGFEFFLDKALYKLDDEILEKASAVFDFVREYTVY